MSYLCGKPTVDGKSCTHRVSLPTGPCSAAKYHHLGEEAPVLVSAQLDMRVAYPMFQWDEYSDLERENLNKWLHHNRGNANLIEEVSEEPAWGTRMSLVLRTGKHVPAKEMTRSQVRNHLNRLAQQTAEELAKMYTVSHTTDSAFGPMVIVTKPGRRAIKLGRTTFQVEQSTGKKKQSKTYHVGVYGSVLSILEDNPDREWNPRLLAAVLGQFGANTNIRTPQSRAAAILAELAERGLITKENESYRALGENRQAILGSERVLPQTVGGILAAEFSKNPSSEGAQLTIGSIAARLVDGGFVQEAGKTMQDIKNIARTAVERLSKMKEGIKYDAASGTCRISPQLAGDMPAIVVDTV